MPALHPLARVVDGIHIGGAGTGQALESHEQPRLVHHLEHGPHALIFLTQQCAATIAFAAERQGAGGISMDSHFFFDTGTDHIIGLAQAAVVVHPNFWHQKQRDAFGTFRRPFDAGQHRVNDVFRHIVLTR